MKLLRSFPKQYRVINNRKYDEYQERYQVENGWLPGSQAYNFERLVEISDLSGVSLHGASVLDVGCGTGDFSSFLSSYSIADYWGIDIYPIALERARSRYPGVTFLEADLLTCQFPTVFTYAFASGTFTVKMPVDNYRFLFSMVKRMWELTTVGVAFNVLTDTDAYPDATLFFYNVERVATLLEDIDTNAHVVAVQDVGKDQAHFYLYRL